MAAPAAKIRIESPYLAHSHDLCGVLDRLGWRLSVSVVETEFSVMLVSSVRLSESE